MAYRFLKDDRMRAAGARIAAVLAAIAIALTPSCDDFLFTPPTGFPEDGPSPRATPVGAIDQLFRAYEDRRIDLFTDLLPRSGTFRFFISPYEPHSGIGIHRPVSVRIDSGQYVNVPQGDYRYWGQDSELAKHRKMFERSTDIEFRPRTPSVNPRDVMYSADSARAELKISDFELCITVGDTVYCTTETSARNTQVFMLEREPDHRTGERLWVIKDWFDFGQ